MTYWGVVPAAGLSTRAQSDLTPSATAADAMPKQYRRIAGASVLEHSVRPLIECERLQGIVVALHADDKHWHSNPLSNEPLVSTVVGGDTRAHSVAQALHALDAADDDWVLIHDGARPCVPVADIHKLLTALHDDAVGGLLAAPMRDTVKWCQDDRVTGTAKRETMMRALTPQMFRYGLLKEAVLRALENGTPPADEAEAMEMAGHSVRVVRGADTNIKVTYPDDFALAEALLCDKDKQWAAAACANHARNQ